MKFPPKATSAARAKLAETISARAEVDAKLAELQSSISRLNSQTAAVAPAQAALAAHDEAEDFAALKWARGEGPIPEPNVEVRDRLARELSAARASAESATRAQATLVAEMTRAAEQPKGIAKYADAAVVEILAETATPMIGDLETAAIELVVKIIGLQTAHDAARDINERRRPRTLSVEDHAIRDMGINVALQRVERPDDNGAPPEALAAVGALSERLRPAVWARVGEAIALAMHDRRADIEAKVAETVGLWKQFERDIREDSGAHFAGVR